MKKLFVLSLLALPLLATAQFNKGNIFLGGTLSTLLQNSDVKPPVASATAQTNNNFGITPSLGFFLNEKIALGSAVTYSTSLQKVDYSQTPLAYTTKTQANSFGISPYIRFYQPITSSIYFGLQGSLSFARSHSSFSISTSTTTTETDGYTVGASVKPMFIFFPSPKWGVETSIGSLGYSYSRTLADDGSSSSFGLSAGSFSFGIAYYFIKK